MPVKAIRSFKRRFIKISLVIVMILMLGFGALYLWFIHNSKDLLIELVKARSAGKLNLDLADVTFDFVNNEVKIDKAKITSTKKGNPAITYQVSFRKITLHTNSIWSLLVHRTLQVKQIKAYDPVIEVYNNRKANPADTINTLSIGKELGKIYNSIQDGITALGTHSIYVINASLILNNKVSSAEKRIVFSNIYFTLKKLHKFNKASGGYVENNNIDFSSSNQAITLSDGIHQLLFKKLSIKQAKSIILDTCTIIALPVHSAGSSYTINFKRLALIGVDFNALYKKSLIKADSVYCENPVSDMRIISRASDSSVAGKGLPNLEKIIKVFSGNLDLGFVGVSNADIRLDIKGRKSMSNIHSGKVNFEIKNLRINPDSTQLVSMSDFDMMVKGYKLYNSDSTCVYSFDSIRFANDKLVLNNVSVYTTSGNNRIRNYRNYTMPHFELSGINWSELVFRQNLQATEAIMYNPTINFIKKKNFQSPGKSLFFNSGHTFDDFMDIDKFKIINGTINIQWGINNSLQLAGLNLGVFGNNISDFKHLRLNRDVQSLFFTSGYLKMANINAQLINVVFKPNNEIRAGTLIVGNSKQGIDAKINDISIKSIYTGKDKNDFIVDGLKWNSGTVNLNTPNGTGKSQRASSILLKNIRGSRTSFKIKNNKLEAGAYVNDIQIRSLFKNNTDPIVINGLQIDGEGMNISDGFLKMKAAKFFLSDEKQVLSGASFEDNNNLQRLSVTAPSLEVTGDIHNIFTKKFNFKNITLQSPVIDFEKRNLPSQQAQKSLPVPPVTIDEVNIFQPDIRFKIQDSAGLGFLLPFTSSGRMQISNFRFDSLGLRAGAVGIQNARASLSRGQDNLFEIDSSLDITVRDINISSVNKSWIGFLDKISLKNHRDFVFNIKESSILLKDINAGNLSVSSSLVKNTQQLLEANPDAWVKTSSAKYLTKTISMQADNVYYDERSKVLSVDSVNYHPIIPRDSAIALNPYQMDYIYFSAGSAVFNDIDLFKTVKDNSISAQKIIFNRPSINVYRDKLPPFLEGVRKELFTGQIKALQIPVSINTIDINDGQVSYIEKNSKSRLEGNVVLAHLNGKILNLKNNDLHPTDSLSVSLAGRLLDQLPFDIQLNQSYVAPLYGFRINLKMQPASLTALNPLLGPLSDVRFVLGNVDKLDMKVTGNDNAAHGTMKFYYHNLRIKLLKNGGVTERKLLRGAESDLVNFFFLKNNNTSRTGLVYFVRPKDRSFYYYINKIIFSGVSTSVGARKNSKFRKISRKDKLSTFE